MKNKSNFLLLFLPFTFYLFTFSFRQTAGCPVNLKRKEVIYAHYRPGKAGHSLAKWQAKQREPLFERREAGLLVNIRQRREVDA
jgi:hypothetical protein